MLSLSLFIKKNNLEITVFLFGLTHLLYYNIKSDHIIFFFFNFRKWGMWAGTPKNQYSQMVYENGEPCWQGGSRSTTVGTTNVTHQTIQQM